MKKIFIYTGKGAYQARDIENFLGVFDFEFERLCEHELRILGSDSILIVPGGRITDYLPSWGKAGVKKIRSFVKAGGVYIGICAGTYIAGTEYNNLAGLNFVARKLFYKKSLGLVTIKNNNEKIQLLKENGPQLQENDGEVLLRDSDNNPQLVRISFGQGLVYLFASHPEGSVYYGKHPKKFSGAKFFNNFLRKKEKLN